MRYWNAALSIVYVVLLCIRRFEYISSAHNVFCVKVIAKYSSKIEVIASKIDQLSGGTSHLSNVCVIWYCPICWELSIIGDI